MAILVPDEHDEQVSLIQWAFLSRKTRPELKGLAAVPNGGLRSKATAGKLKAEGVRAGYLDLQLLVARGGYHGLLIEMKRTKDSTTSPEQKEWIKWHTEQGFYATVCKGFLAAKRVIEDYLDGHINADKL